MKTTAFLPTIIAAATLFLPATGLSGNRKITYNRDLDGDGHFNKKSYNVGHHYHGRGYSGYSHYGRPYYGSGYYGSGYYGSGYYGSGYYGSRGYGHGYGYGYYPRSLFGISFFSRPRVISRDRVYHGRVAEYSDGLALDVQRELKRRGYYGGSLDGNIGPRSRAAIRAYQRDRGLSSTGRIDQSLLRSLRIG